MRLLLLFALQTTIAPAPSRVPTLHDVLAAEHSRGTDLNVLDAALASRDTVLQRAAARALGRWERLEYAPRLTPLLNSPAASVRREAVNAFGQMNAPFDFTSMMRDERSPAVRAAILESIGRSSAAAASGQLGPNAPLVRVLVAGLLESDAVVRAGAARGTESLLRRTARSPWTRTLVLDALHGALRNATDAETRQLILLAMTAANDRDSASVAIALRDTSALVRRAAVALSRQWIDDPSYIVRYQALRVAGTCERAAALLHDDNQHVALTAVDVLGEKQCDANRLDSLVRRGASWRTQSHAIVALARVDSAKARAALPVVASSKVWQARAWAAQAAKMSGATAIAAELARDTAPNVAAAALTTDDDAHRALTSAHSGLVLAAATHYKGAASLTKDAPLLTDALLRLSARNVATNRDPRAALLQRLLEGADSTTALRLKPLTRDVDPEIAALAARVITERAHVRTAAETERYTPAPFPTAATLASLRSATARITMRGLGTMEIALFTDEAPATVAAFAALVDRKAFNGLTWHRIVPNFVLQGGSPGADEYDAITTTFLRDELGFARQARGAFGISTRGRDTGDGQLFINLIDNFRLDHDYTVMAAMTKGFEVMDRIQEGDVIERVEIVRKK